MNLEKAYDHIRWPFLEVVICKIDFNPSLISLIKFCISFASLVVLWNGEHVECFVPSRGLRQGDPLSPYLFILCMESLSMSITQSIADGASCWLKASRIRPGISHLFFYDDLLFFGEAPSVQACIMEQVLAKFCQESGQKVNTSKSKLFVS